MSRTRKFTTERSAKDRRDLGAVYTPLWMARYIVDKTFGANTVNQVLDPACGDGVFLQAAFERLLAQREITRQQSLTLQDQVDLATTHLYGIDLDASAVVLARQRIAQTILQSERERISEDDFQIQQDSIAEQLEPTIVQGNTLLDASDRSIHQDVLAVDWKQFPTESFDAIIGNPPYVNIRRIAQSYSTNAREYLKNHYLTATGNYDLYVLFLELANQRLRENGRAGFIIPNKIGTMQYARACRELLLQQTTIKQLVDASEMDVFQGTGVYPYIVVWEKTEPNEQTTIDVIHARLQRELNSTPSRQLRQVDLDSEKGFAIHGTVDVESRVKTLPLGEVCKLYSGTTGFAAQETAAVLHERTSNDGSLPFIVSGNIDRYQIELGSVRFMKRQFDNPGLPHGTSAISDAKRKLFSEPKIVIAGLTRELEAAWDEQGLALGVQVYAATDFQLDHWYVLALLNSQLMTELFRVRFQAKHLAGGYLAINKGQLQCLPVALGSDETERDLIHQLSKLAQQQHKKFSPTRDKKINQLTRQLYRLDETPTSADSTATNLPATSK